MKKFGIIGHQINYTQSPFIHKKIAKHFSFDLNYEVLDCEAKDIKIYLSELKAGLFDGFNVTKPFKEIVIDYLEDISPKAAKIGAVNTIFIKNGKIYGDNTDYDGFVYLIESLNLKIDDLKTYILGSGGSAKACYVALIDLGCNVNVVSRHIDQHWFSHVISYEALKHKKVDLYINTITKDVDIFDIYQIKPQKNTVMIDINYSPLVTKPMQHFNKAFNGIEMLIVQAIKSQSLWFDQELVISKKLIEEIKEDIL